MALIEDLLFGPFKGVGVCTFCGSKENVLCYPPTREERIAWNARHNCKYPNEKCDEFEPTFCPECCAMQLEGHEFTYDRSDQQYTCDNCGDFPPGDWQGYYCDDGY